MSDLSTAPDAPAAPPQPKMTTGCILFVVMAAWLLMLGGWMLWRMYGQVREMRTFTDPAAQSIVPAQPDAARVQALQTRLSAFGTAVERDEAAKLELTAEDLNDLLAFQEPVSRLKDMLKVEEITDVLRVRVALAINGIPFTGERLYFNGFLSVRPDRRESSGVVLLTRDLEVPGRPLTEGFKNTYLQANHVDGLVFDEVREDARLKAILQKITAVQTLDGKVTVEFSPAPKAAPVPVK